MQRPGYCLQCGSKTLFDETILDNMTSCYTNNIQVARNRSFDKDVYRIEENNHGEKEVQEEDLYTSKNLNFFFCHT